MSPVRVRPPAPGPETAVRIRLALQRPCSKRSPGSYRLAVRIAERVCLCRLTGRSVDLYSTGPGSNPGGGSIKFVVAGVAQVAEHRIRNAEAETSIVSTSSRF